MKLLAAIESAVAARELAPLLREADDRPGVDVVAWVATAAMEAVVREACRGVLCVGPGTSEGRARATERGPGSIPSVRAPWARDLARALTLRRRADRLLDDVRPDVVVVADDRSFGLGLALRFRAQRAPTLVVPCAASDPRADARVRAGHRRHRTDLRGPTGWLARCIARRMPGQSHDGLLFYPPGATLALRSLGMLPARPWAIGGSGPAAVAAADGSHARLLEAAGTSQARVVATGRPSDDALASGLAERDVRRRLRFERLGRPDSALHIVLAPPHLGEHRLRSAEDHERSTTALFDGLADALESERGERAALVSVCLHPRSDPVQYADHVRRAGFVLEPAALRDVLPTADVFVCGPSSTVWWARSLGLPVVTLDELDLGPAWAGDDGVWRIVRPSELGPALGSALRAGGCRAPGAVDGRACRRIVDLAMSLAADGTTSRFVP